MNQTERSGSGVALHKLLHTSVHTITNTDTVVQCTPHSMYVYTHKPEQRESFAQAIALKYYTKAFARTIAPDSFVQTITNCTKFVKYCKIFSVKTIISKLQGTEFTV